MLTTQQNTRTSESDATPITYTPVSHSQDRGTTCEGSGVDSQGKDEENDLPLNLGEVGKAADLEDHFIGDRYGMGCYGPVIEQDHTEIDVSDIAETMVEAPWKKVLVDKFLDHVPVHEGHGDTNLDMEEVHAEGDAL